MGYLDTLKTFGQVSGLGYYIKDLPDDSAIIEYLLKIPSNHVRRLLHLMRLSLPPSTRTVFEQLVPMIGKLFGCSKDNDYTNILLTIIEYMATIYELERLKIYTFHELMYLVLHAMKTSKAPIPPTESSYSLESIKERLGFSPSKQQVAQILLNAYSQLY